MAEELPEPRDFHWEQAYTRELQKEGEKLGISTSAAIINRAMKRLTVGGQIHGNSFRNRDILSAARDKAADLVAYTLLEAQKRNSEETNGQHYLFEAAKYAMMAEYYLRMSKQYEHYE